MGSTGGDTAVLTPPTPAIGNDVARGFLLSFRGERTDDEGTSRTLAVRCHSPSFQLFTTDLPSPNNITKEVSPSDIFSFPAPPSTPFKAKESVSRTPSREMTVEQRNGAACHRSRFEEDFNVIGTLGNGSFGMVYKCMSTVDGCLYAIKVVKKKVKGVASRENMLREVYALAALCDQPDPATFHIVRYHQAWMEDCQLYI